MPGSTASVTPTSCRRTYAGAVVTVTVEVTAGVTLAATEALRVRRDRLWTNEQVSYLIALAFESGRTSAADERIAEVRACWLERIMSEKARDLRAERLAYYERCAEKIAQQMGRPAGYVYAGGPVDFETGRPLRHLVVAA